jgi:signal transduction histidine kinase
MARDGAEVALVWRPVNLASGAEKICAYYQGQADRKGIRLVLVPAGPETFVWADAVATAVVLDNLLSNAIKYSPPGAEVQVRVVTEPGHQVCSVCDQGPGLGPEQQAKLFQRGARLGSVPTGGEESTGFGLAVAKELIDRLGGELWCESEVGKGSCFSFRLPLYAEEQQG